ncbi:MAG: hypothetical protein LC122_03990 [Chitinophagales bacterium]|nr:hypothetical protein [Chitinophagales bacterium]
MKQLIFLLTILLTGLQLSAQSQSEQALNLPEGNYSAYKVENNKFIKTLKHWGVSFVKGTDVVVAIKINRLGIIEEEFKADLAENPAYFMYEGKRTIIIDGNIFYYEFKANKASIVYVLSPEGKSISGNVEEWNAKIVEKQKGSLSNQSETRAELAAKAKAKEEAEIAASSLKGKKVKSLKIVLIDGLEKNTHGSIINYGVEAVFEDGKISKTNSLGGKMPWNDLEIKISGGIYTEGAITVNDDASEIPGDQVVINVKSKYQPLSDKKEIEILYNDALELNYSGSSSSIYRSAYNGMRGGSLIINAAKAVSAKGKSIIKLEIRGAANNEVLHRYKIGQGGLLTIYANGQNGMIGDKRHSGGNGGDGGDITIYASPSIGEIPITVFNSGGDGGKNRENPYNVGSRGRNGTKRIIRQNVNLSW